MRPYLICRGEGARIEQAMVNMETVINERIAGRSVVMVGSPVVVDDSFNERWHILQAFVDVGPVEKEGGSTE